MLIFTGNLLNRTLGLLKKNCNATIAADATFIPENNPMRVLAIESVSVRNLCIEQFDLQDPHCHILFYFQVCTFKTLVC